MVDLSYFICSFYTLCEDNKFFRTFNLGNGNLEFKILDDTAHRTVFSKLLNKISLNKLAFDLIEPLLNQNSILIESTSKSIKKNGKLDEETILLKIYLRKFNYNYRRYFLYLNDNFVNLPTNKKINMSAIECLFLLAGV